VEVAAVAVAAAMTLDGLTIMVLAASQDI
jgi:hypothetical protein